MPIVVKVSFNSSKSYHYICDYPVEQGDTVVVDTPYNGLSCAKVESVHDYPDSRATKRVVQVVDQTEYRAIQQREYRKAQLKKELDRRMEKIEDMARYRLLQQMDPEAADLLAEYQKLAA